VNDYNQIKAKFLTEDAIKRGVLPPNAPLPEEKILLKQLLFQAEELFIQNILTNASWIMN
jgi:hypothetical protein